MRITQPFVLVRCDGCAHVYEQQVGMGRAKKNVEDLDDERPHLCAECAETRRARG